MQLHVAFATLVTAAFTSADALVPVIQAITGCTVLSYSVTYSSVDNDPAAPIGGSRVEDKGRFIFRLANTLNTKVEIPGIIEAVLLPSGAIDVENPAVVDFLQAIIDSPAIYRGVDGADITAIKSAYQAFRRSTKNMLPSGRDAFGGA
jgi:hypothetical protein